MKKKKLTALEIQTRGGQATLKKLGKKHYKDMAKKRWAKVKKVAKKK
jgi:hypothetical protein